MTSAIDLNSDLGENVPDRVVSDDAAMLDLVTSANVSCGFHAGSPEGIRETLAAATKGGVVIGAHPGYDDYEGFGRRPLDVPAATLQAQVEYQIGALLGLTAAVGGSVAYVKPHGGLYNAIVRDEAQAKVVVAAVKAVDPSLVFLGLAGSVANRVAAEAGLTVAAEAFADRSYNPDGSLVARTEPNAVLHDPQAVAARVLRLVQTGQVEAIDGSLV
ncbi:MAG: LamB/YcsF family protein, partial [Brevibacterium aurantiacum]